MSTVKEKQVVVDVEWFRYKKEPPFTKEIAISGDYLDSIILKPPRNFYDLDCRHKNAFNWLIQNMHGLFWDSGDYSYLHLIRFVESVKLRYGESCIYYAKGYEKCIFLSSLFGKPFMNLDTLGCPQVTNAAYTCSFESKVHQSRGNHCARNKAHFYHDWLQNVTLNTE